MLKIISPKEQNLITLYTGGASFRPPVQETWEKWVWSLGKIPQRRARQPTPVFFPGESHGQRSLSGFSPWSLKELDMTEWLTLTYLSPSRFTKSRWSFDKFRRSIAFDISCKQVEMQPMHPSVTGGCKGSKLWERRQKEDFIPFVLQRQLRYFLEFLFSSSVKVALSDVCVLSRSKLLKLSFLIVSYMCIKLKKKSYFYNLWKLQIELHFRQVFLLH